MTTDDDSPAQLADNTSGEPGARWSSPLPAAVVSAAVLAPGLGLWFEVSSAISAVEGVALSTVNLAFLERVVRALARPGRAQIVWALMLPVKFLLVVAVGYALLRAGMAEPAPLALGFATLPLAFALLRLGRRSAQPTPSPE